MGKLRQTALILGEGPTEFFYFKSLCDVYNNLTIKPDYPKHTSIKELEAKIEEGITMGYSYIFCVIDMDTKDKEPEHTQYIKLKAKYAKPVNKPKIRYILSRRVFRDPPLHRIIFSLLFPLHIPFIPGTRIVD